MKTALLITPHQNQGERINVRFYNSWTCFFIGWASAKQIKVLVQSLVGPRPTFLYIELIAMTLNFDALALTPKQTPRPTQLTSNEALIAASGRH